MTHPLTQHPATPPAGPAPSPAAWKDADRAQRRAMIIGVGLRLLTEEGPDALTMRRVARELGVGAMTLYTYIDGQPGLHRAMVTQGFDIIHHNCATACQNQQNQEAQGNTPDDGSGGWFGGARSYVQFAIEHPNLYRLMFDTPVDADDDQFDQLMHGGFQGLHTVVRERLETQGLKGHTLDTETRKLAGRYWIALHGLATLAIAGRMQVLHGTLDEVLLHLLEAVAPTKV